MIITNENSSSFTSVQRAEAKTNESGAALATAILVMALLSAIAVTALAIVRTETRIAGSDLKRTQTFYAASAGIEKMTSDFSQLFAKTSRPTTIQMNGIANSPPPGLNDEGYTLSQSLAVDAATLAAMRATQNKVAPAYPDVLMGADSPFSGLNASVNPYTLTTTATGHDGTQVGLTRQMNNYLIPIFQFGVFSDNDLEFWPEPPMTFNGRVHSNGNIYFGGDVTFLQRVTTANEAVRDKLRNNAPNTTGVGGASGYYSDPRFKVNPLPTASPVRMTQGSVLNGPNILIQPRTDGRGNFNGSPTGFNPSPTGTDNPWWKTSSVSYFGGLMLSKSTGVLPLKLPLQLQEIQKQPLELIKRAMPDDNRPGFDALSNSRYQTKAEIRILIDDENAGNGAANAAGIGNDPVTGLQKGVALSTFNPMVLDSGRALRVVGDNGAYLSTVDWFQGDPARNRTAQTVRGIRNDYAGAILAATANANTGGTNATAANFTSNQANAAIPKTPNNAIIPTGAGIRGRILIEIVPPPDADGTPNDPIDVTREILSMGMTMGEPNGIVLLQRPEWAAFMQGARDRKGDSNHHNFLLHFLDNSVSDRRALGDSEIRADVAFNSTGFINSTDNSLDDDPHSGSTPFQPTAATMSRDDKPGTGLNRIVPINVYNVREGRMDETLTSTNVYQRGISSVIDINMRNLARWVDGVYDATLLLNTNAVTANIDGSDGYVVYISDRRGDRVKAERNANLDPIQTTNGTVDNEDVYNYAAASPALNPGEDLIDDGFDLAITANKKGSLQLDRCELPSPLAVSALAVTRPAGAVSAAVDSTNYSMAAHVSRWNPAVPASMSATCTPAYATANQYWFRRAVRVFNGENLQITGNAGRLSQTKGISISTENMIYVWGNYNTTGINQAPAAGVSSLNDPAATSRYLGNQVPSSIVADAFFPLSKTWYDALPAMYPEGSITRIADAGSASDWSVIPVGQETSVRAGIIAGSTQSAMVGASAPTGSLDWLNGGVHNFPRFLEMWSYPTVREERWNYAGSFIMLYNSTQAVGPWSVQGAVVYYPPIRNWSFDTTFTDPNRLPPGTPQFQHVEPTGFRQIL